MRKDQWEYKISAGFTGVVLSFIMLAIFGGISIWLYTGKNGAFLFGMILTVIMFVVFLVALYRAVFYKVLIGKDGLYYQTNPGNGKYYDYSEIEKAWISSGRNLNGTEGNYCNYETIDGKLIRFPFFPADFEGIEYLLKSIEAKANNMAEGNADDSNREYQINGKVYGKASIVIAFVLLTVFVVLGVSLAQYEVLQFAFASSIIVAAIILVAVVIRYLSFKVQIESTGFYFRSNPFNGNYYEYSEIKSCEEVMKVYKHHRRGEGTTRTYYFYFIFTDKNGKTRKFQFEKPIFEHEVNVLKARIENAKS